MKTAWVVFEKLQSGILTPGYEPITVYPDQNETFESVLKAVYPEYVYKGVFENRNDARGWVDNWRLQMNIGDMVIIERGAGLPIGRVCKVLEMKNDKLPSGAVFVKLDGLDGWIDTRVLRVL
jgi:hypothetical protein